MKWRDTDIYKKSPHLHKDVVLHFLKIFLESVWTTWYIYYKFRITSRTTVATIAKVTCRPSIFSFAAESEGFKPNMKVVLRGTDFTF
jgi:hypothetical protein